MNFDIKMIQVDGSFKALVIDLNKTEGRLVAIVEHTNEAKAYNEAKLMVSQLEASYQGQEQCH